MAIRSFGDNCLFMDKTMVVSIQPKFKYLIEYFRPYIIGDIYYHKRMYLFVLNSYLLGETLRSTFNKIFKVLDNYDTVSYLSIRGSFYRYLSPKPGNEINDVGETSNLRGVKGKVKFFIRNKDLENGELSISPIMLFR